MKQGVFKIGAIRPPNEANSLLLQVTENCSWNKCKFCMLYKEKAFRTRPVDDIKKDIDYMVSYRDMIVAHKRNGQYDLAKIQKEYYELEEYEQRVCYQMVFTWLTEGNKESMFLQDANTIVLRPEWLIEIISYARERLPELKRITSYGRADTLARISVEDLKKIREAGLDRIHSGFESGSDKVLQLIGKGTTQQDQIIGGKKVKEAGIELSIYFMPGVGGVELSEENAIETAKVINEINPDFVRLRTFILRTGSLMEELRNDGLYHEQKDIEKLIEIKKMLTHIDPKKVTSKIDSEHIINLLQDVKGDMSKDLPSIINYIDSYLSLPEFEQKKYQLARRMGFHLDWEYLDDLQEADEVRIESMIKNITSDEEWEKLLHKFTNCYI